MQRFVSPALPRALLAVVLGALISSPLAAAELVERVSVDVDGGEVTRTSTSPAVSANGRFVAFVSSAEGLVPAPGGGKRQVYVRERRTGVTERVSVNGRRAGNGDSYSPALSGDGRFVVYETLARNLAPGAAGGRSNVVLHDRLTGENTLVSAAADGSAGNGASRAPAISADGRVVAYASTADDLVETDTNASRDVFVFERLAGTTERVSDAVDGAEGNADSDEPDLSADGRQVAFVSAASNLVADDDDDRQDAFVRDRLTDTTVRANLQSDGSPGGAGVSLARISADGARVAFFAKGSGLAPGSSDRDVYVKTLASARIEAFGAAALAPSDGPYDIDAIDIDGDGCRVVFELVPRGADEPPTAWLRDCEDGAFRALPAGAFAPSSDAAGRNLAFVSASGALVPDDDNGLADVFLLDTGDPCSVDAAPLVRTLKDGTWATLSLPCEPPPDAERLADVFDELEADDYDRTWVVYTFDTTGAGDGEYVKATLDTRLRAGEGFWMNQSTGEDVDVRLPVGSNRVPRDTLSLGCETSRGCWRLTLSGDRRGKRVNLVGNPFDRTVPVGDVVTSAPEGACSTAAGCTFEQASDRRGANLFTDPWVRWDDTAEVPAYDELGDGDGLTPWSGVWIGERRGARRNTPVLDLPYGD